MARESAEEKIARIVRETMASERRSEEEKANPAMGKLRALIREEVGGVLGDLLNDSGDADDRPGSRRRRSRDEGEGEEGDILKALGLR